MAYCSAQTRARKRGISSSSIHEKKEIICTEPSAPSSPCTASLRDAISPWLTEFDTPWRCGNRATLRPHLQGVLDAQHAHTGARDFIRNPKRQITEHAFMHATDADGPRPRRMTNQFRRLANPVGYIERGLPRVLGFVVGVVSRNPGKFRHPRRSQGDQLKQRVEFLVLTPRRTRLGASRPHPCRTPWDRTAGPATRRVRACGRCGGRRAPCSMCLRPRCPAYLHAPARTELKCTSCSVAPRTPYSKEFLKIRSFVFVTLGK